MVHRRGPTRDVNFSQTDIYSLPIRYNFTYNSPLYYYVDIYESLG